MIKFYMQAGYQFATKSFVLIILCFAFPVSNAFAQSSQDTIIVLPADSATVKTKRGSIFSGRPGKSLLMSLVVPGAGQIYNKSYLRVPFVWGAVGGVGAWMLYETRVYNCRREAYKAAVDGTVWVKPGHCKDDFTNYDAARIRSARDVANNNRQLAIVAFSLVWLANGVDAFVDAHLKDFDIDEDLSIDIGPMMDDDPNAPMRVGVFVKF